MNHTSWHYCVHLYWHACVLILTLQHVTYLVELTLWLINCHVYRWTHFDNWNPGRRSTRWKYLTLCPRQA